MSTTTSGRSCPLCNTEVTTPHPDDPAYLVCPGCAETLTADELVATASDQTRRDYITAHNLNTHPDYQCLLGG